MILRYISKFSTYVKKIRSCLIPNLILIDSGQYKYIKTLFFVKAVELGPVFTDRPSSESMKNAITLFS